MTTARPAPDESVCPVTVGSLVAHVEVILGAARLTDASLEARDLVAAVAGEGRFWPRLQAASPAADDLVERATAAARARASGAPFAYAVGRASFRHLTLRVDQRVLIPRQETEVLVDLVLAARAARTGGVVADVGTGSGAIALALASEGSFDRVVATDVAADALAVARRNAGFLRPEAQRRLEFRAGDLLAPLAGERLDVLVSNPPYIAFTETQALPAAVRDWEPPQALLSPEDGLAHTRRLVAGAPVLLCRGGLLALEVDARRASRVSDMVASAGFADVTVRRDLAGRDRFVLAVRR
jgi:release factor glutamine methyltransferase